MRQMPASLCHLCAQGKMVYEVCRGRKETTTEGKGTGRRTGAEKRNQLSKA